MSTFSLFDPSHTGSFYSNLKAAHTELAKKELFISYISLLYAKDEDAQNIIKGMAHGAEKFIAKIPRKDRIGTGKADTNTDTLIVEWEKDLKKTGDHARDQLKEYLVGNWNSGKPYEYTLIATDGLSWVRYAPNWSSPKKASISISLTDLELREIERFDLNPDTFAAFPLFLDAILFRDSERPLTPDAILTDFGDTSKVFINSMRTLQEIAEQVEADTELKTAFSQWRTFLSVAYGKFDDSPQMFMVHTYLSLFSKLLAYTVLVRKPVSTDAEVRKVLTGEAFLHLQIERFVEDDFFHWVADDRFFSKCAPVFRSINRALADYKFDAVKEDILKGVYQELIDLETRHALGEYYTPDWLCDQVVSHLNPQFPSRILDPACGSGSFLRAAITNLRRDNPNLSASEICSCIYGIDIHPLSVQIAKTTIILALSDLITRAKKPIALNIYLANSVLVPDEYADIFKSIYHISVDNKSYKVNLHGIGSDSKDFDALIDICAQIVEQNSNIVTLSEFSEIFLSNEDPRYSDWYQDLYPLYVGMKIAKIEGRDSIWKFIIQNSYKPVFLRGTFDYVIGNPPWFTYKSISNVKYQASLRELAERYGVLPRKVANLTHLEIAAIFLGHSSAYFLNDGGQLGFVLPRSFLTADQHDRTRDGSVKSLALTEIWDLKDVKPIFRVPCCVLFGRQERREDKKNANYSSGLAGKAGTGKLPRAEVPTDLADKLVSWTDATWHVNRIRMGKKGVKSAFSTRQLDFGGSVNAYFSQFAQGATLLPRSFFFVQELNGKALVSLDDDGTVATDNVLAIRTSDDAVATAKKPWNSVRLEGRIESRFVFRTAISQNVLPFTLINPPCIVLPVEIDKKTGAPSILSSNQLLAKGHRHASRWFHEAEQKWDENRTEKSAVQGNDLHWRLDYQRTLTNQNVKDKFVVLYTSSSKDASACVLDRSNENVQLDVPFIVDHKTYWVAVKSLEEAHYLCAFLNSGFVNDIIKDFQSTGLMGARDVHKTVLGVPLPKFNPRNNEHKELAGLSLGASAKAKHLIAGANSGQLGMNALGSLRNSLRRALRSEIASIDKIIVQLTGLKNLETLRKAKKRRKTVADQGTLPLED